VREEKEGTYKGKDAICWSEGNKKKGEGGNSSPDRKYAKALRRSDPFERGEKKKRDSIV